GGRVDPAPGDRPGEGGPADLHRGTVGGRPGGARPGGPGGDGPLAPGDRREDRGSRRRGGGRDAAAGRRGRGRGWRRKRGREREVPPDGVSAVIAAWAW